MKFLSVTILIFTVSFSIAQSDNFNDEFGCLFSYDKEVIEKSMKFIKKKTFESGKTLYYYDDNPLPNTTKVFAFKFESPVDKDSKPKEFYMITSYDAFKFWHDRLGEMGYKPETISSYSNRDVYVTVEEAEGSDGKISIIFHFTLI